MDIEQRKKESLCDSIGPVLPSGFDLKGIIFTSPTDAGVIRNGGRSGARFAPETLIHHLKKFSRLTIKENDFFLIKEVNTEREETEGFGQSQKNSQKKILDTFRTFEPKKIVHLGGGNDHAYAFGSALAKSQKKIFIINVDAHADTRTDSEPHSGTPFRQLLNEFPNINLHEYGLHPFLNSKSTLSNLKNTSFTYASEIPNGQLPQSLLNFLEGISKEDILFLSIDADALNIKAVSAANPVGLPIHHLIHLQDYLLKKFPQVTLGIYEYNPMFDETSSVDGKSLCVLIYNYLQK